MSIALVSTDSVRAVLGVSSKELTDAVLGNVIYATQLKEDLLEMNDQIVTDFATIGALVEPDKKQQRFLDLMQTYAAYNVAQQCLTGLPMFSPLTIKDEKAELTRNADFYAQLKVDVGAALSVIKTRLLTAYAAAGTGASAPNTVDRIYGVTTGLATDPVTGS